MATADDYNSDTHLHVWTSENVDGISGATLSVNALKRMAALALFLHEKVTENGTKKKAEKTKLEKNTP